MDASVHVVKSPRRYNTKTILINMWIIENEKKQEMHQFGAFFHESDAYRVLRKAIEKIPKAKYHIAKKKDSVK